MPNLTTRDMNKIAEMFDQQFYQLIERVDKNYEGGGQIEPPKPKAAQRHARVPENLVQARQENLLLELSQKGLI